MGRLSEPPDVLIVMPVVCEFTVMLAYPVVVVTDPKLAPPPPLGENPLVPL